MLIPVIRSVTPIIAVVFRFADGIVIFPLNPPETASKRNATPEMHRSVGNGVFAREDSKANMVYSFR